MPLDPSCGPALRPALNAQALSRTDRALRHAAFPCTTPLQLPPPTYVDNQALGRNNRFISPILSTDSG